MADHQEVQGLVGMTNSLLRWSALFMLVTVHSVNAADPTYLRCTYTETMPFDPGRFMIISIDPDHHLIRFDEHGEVLNSTTTYRLDGDE